MKEVKQKKGRGSGINPPNPYHNLSHDYEQDLEDNPYEYREDVDEKTQFIKVHPKTIINKVISADIPIMYSVNPYQGCEHGCIYCYARPTHNYWGYSAGTEFETRIMVKENAASLLRREVLAKKWKVAPISFSGNTDCYQPAERKFQITRQMLQVMTDLKHPVGIITKNSLILRDLDLLQQLQKDQLIRVYISITTLDETLRRAMEPRTASISQKLKTIETLSKAGIPVGVMMAPVIPGLNSHEIIEMAKVTSDAGALDMGYTVVRLNGQLVEIFKSWLAVNYPERSDKIIHQIEELHGGQLEDKRTGKRMRGEGKLAEIIKDTFRLARQKYFNDNNLPELNLGAFIGSGIKQLVLFE